MVQTKKHLNRCTGFLLVAFLLTMLSGCGNLDISGASGSSAGISGGGSPGVGGGGSSGVGGGGGIVIGGVGTGGTGIVKSSVVTQKIDGTVLYANAVVFYDLNRNGLLDNDEPFAQTDPQGSYTLAPPPGALPDTPLLIKVVAGATVSLASGQVVPETSTTTVTDHR